MNVLFLLVPKREVIYLPVDSSIRQAFETLRAHNHAIVPVLDNEGHYVGTISTCHILNFVYNQNIPSLQDLEDFPISLLIEEDANPPFRIDLNFSDLLDRLQDANFVAVIDDRDLFMGIITRKALMSYLRTRMEQTLDANETLEESIERSYGWPLGSARLHTI